MKTFVAIVVLACLAKSAPLSAEPFEGPGRFCGYAAIVDLEQDETIETTRGGIHGGSFIWRGPFGELRFSAIGWAAKPSGRKAKELTSTGQTLFLQTRQDGLYKVRIWNRRNGVVSFSSEIEFTDQQLSAIDRVYVFDEWDKPEGCRFQTIFVWD